MRLPQGQGENKRRMKTVRLLVAVVFLLNTSGCSFSIPTLKGHRKEGMGLPISVLKEINVRDGSYASSIGWKETTYTLPNGNWVYVDPYAPNCLVHWEVNPEGIIVGSRVEGNGCDMWPFR